MPGTIYGGHVINTYDASDERVIRQSYGPTHNTVYVFDTLELRMSDLITSGSPPTSDYTLDKWREVPYLIVNGVRLARINYAENSPEINGVKAHVFLELGDHLGSTNIVIDHATSELVERGTYQAYGAAESDYRPDRWENFREDYKFTGKEEDVTVGLHYFGKRFLSTHLNRWVSADPLAVHVPGEADLNLYAYVSGRALQAVDPMGLDSGLCTGPGGCSGTQTRAEPSEPPKLAAAVYSGALAASGISPWASAAFDRIMVETARKATPEDRREIAQGLLAASATLAAAGLAVSEGGPSTGARVGSAVGPEGTVLGVVLGTAGGLSLGMQLRVSAGLTAAAGATVYAMGTTPPSDPKFAGANPSRDQTGLKDHARRHSDKSPSEYLKQGQQNIKEGKMLKGAGRDAEARYWVRRVGKNEYSVTITNKKNTIKSIDTWRNRNPKTDQLNKLTKQHVMKGLEKSGVTPPKGFWDSL